MHIFLDKVLNRYLFSGLLKNLVTALREGISQWAENTNVERLKTVSGVRWEAENMYVVGHRKAVEIFSKM